MYVCGWNGNGQLGIGHFININVPVPVLGLQQQIIKIACGWNHTMSLTSMSNVVNMYIEVPAISCYADLGEIYTWGSNSFGQLGLPRVHRHTSTPERLSHEVNMSACIAAWIHTYLLGFC